MRKVKLVDLISPYEEIKDELFKVWEEIFTGMRLFLGPYVQKFEKEFAKYCGTEYGVALSSGTDALHLSLRAAGISSGDEVILPSFTFIACLEAVWMVGAIPVFCEIDPNTYCLDTDDVERKITDRTKAIISVHLFGNPCDMQPLWNIKDKKNIWLIEDASQAHGAEYKGSKVGSLGDISAFSFYFTKNLGALGEAGAITTNNPDLYEKIKLMRVHGQVSQYSSRIMGFNFRMDEIQAATLLLKLKKLDLWNKRRQKIANLYRKYLKDVPIKMPSSENSVYNYFVIQASERDNLVRFLREKGVEVGVHYPLPCHLQEAAKTYNYQKGNLPITEDISEKVLSLPSHPYLTEEDIKYIGELFTQFFKSF